MSAPYIPARSTPPPSDDFPGRLILLLLVVFGGLGALLLYIGGRYGR